MRISIDGQLVESITFNGNEPEFNYGYGVFETMRTYNGTPFHAEDHLERLHNSAEAIQLTLPADYKKILDWIKPHCTSTSLTPSTPNHRRIKIIAAHEHIYILSEPLPIQSQLYTTGVSLQLTALERQLPHAKLLSYVPEYLAHRTAKTAGYYDALLMTGTQEVREAAFANFFIVKNNAVITPRHNILQGITRKIVMDLASQHYEVIQRKLTLEEIMVADEAFITQTTTGVLPVVTIDKHIVGTGQPGEVTLQIMELFTTYVTEYTS